MNLRDKDSHHESKRKSNIKRTPKVPKKISERYLKNSGLYYLQKFTASSGHFKSVMRRKIQKSCRHHTDQDFETCLEMLEKITAEFIELGYLNDDLYLKGMVQSLRRSGKSRNAIIAKLSQKSVPRDDIETALQDYETRMEEYAEYDHDTEFEAALTFARKKRLGPYDTLNKNDAQKTLAIFARNGFSYDIAKKICALSQEELN